MAFDWNAFIAELRDRKANIESVITGIEKLMADGTLQAGPVLSTQMSGKNETAALPTAVNRSKRSVEKAAKTEGICTKHQGVGVTKEGECKRCYKSRYMKEYLDERKKGAGPRREKKARAPEVGSAHIRKLADFNHPSTPVESPDDDDRFEEDDDEPVEAEEIVGEGVTDLDEELRELPPVPVPAGDFVFSKPCKCPKCGAPGIRLQRRRAADMAKDHWLHVKPGQQPCTIKISHYKIKDDQKFMAVGA